MSIKNLKIGSNYILDPQDRYEDNLLEVKILNITGKAVKWERQDVSAEDRRPTWVLASTFNKNYTIVEELENA